MLYSATQFLIHRQHNRVRYQYQPVNGKQSRCSEKHSKLTNTLQKDAYFIGVRPGRTKSNHLALNG